MGKASRIRQKIREEKLKSKIIIDDVITPEKYSKAREEIKEKQYKPTIYYCHNCNKDSFNYGSIKGCLKESCTNSNKQVISFINKMKETSGTNL